MKKQSNLSRLLDYAGTYRILSYLSWVLAAAGALLALVPFWYIWCILREVIEVAPNYENAVHVTHYDWMAVVFAFAAVFGLIGFLDDFQKVKMHRNLGLTAIQKFALQLAAAVVFLCLMRYEGMLTPNLYVPFANTYVILPWIVYMIFAAFVIVGTVNAVNITDGIDGLAGSVTVPVALFFAVVGSWWGYENNLGVFAAAMVGGLIGFLVYNFHPAKVFMGDTGSLFLGGAVAGLAFAYDMPLVLLLVGIVYICETLSDIIQVAYFKATHGKRIFKMAPLHHHFELCGWSEVKLVTIFTLVSAVFCMLALWGVIGRYHF